MNWKSYTYGIRRGLPVGVGYFSVSFGFGAMAAAQGIRALDATLISITNLTSAGQFAGLTLMVAGATLWEVILTQIVINSRYALMSLALSQRMGSRIGVLPRQPLSEAFMLGLGLTPILGWTAGTLCGALAGSVLPLSIRTALGVMLYGMFVAIVVPPAKSEKSVLAVVIIALLLSCLFKWLPLLAGVSAGIAIVCCTVIAAALCAWLFPMGEEEDVA